MIINLYFVFHPNHPSEAILLVQFVKFSILKLPSLKICKIIFKIFNKKAINMLTSHSESISFVKLVTIIWLNKMRKDKFVCCIILDILADDVCESSI